MTAASRGTETHDRGGAASSSGSGTHFTIHLYLAQHLTKTCLTAADWANIPPSILLLGYWSNVLQLQQLQNAEDNNPLADRDVVQQIKKAVAKLLHPNAAGTTATNAMKALYSDFNARVHEVLNPIFGNEGWQRFSQLFRQEYIPMQQALQPQMQ